MIHSHERVMQPAKGKRALEFSRASASPSNSAHFGTGWGENKETLRPVRNDKVTSRRHCKRRYVTGIKDCIRQREDRREFKRRESSGNLDLPRRRALGDLATYDGRSGEGHDTADPHASVNGTEC